MLTVLTLIFFVFGLIIGSFLNVVILRHNTERHLGGRSACMSCSTTLTWYELVPLGSYLALGGRCKSCKTKISIQYPLVELATGVLFAFLFLKLQYLFLDNFLNFFFTYAFYALIFAVLVVIATYDLKHKIIPDIFSLVLGAISFIGLFFFTPEGFNPHMPALLNLLSGPLIALPLASLWFFSKGTWMGLGDGKLALGLGWMVGFSQAVGALVLSFWIGAFFGIVLILFSTKYKMKTEIPFAPFLVLGTIISFLFDLHLFPRF